MSESPVQQSQDVEQQLTILVGSGVRLLCGECGVFVVSNEAFDPQSSAEYVPYHVDAAMLPDFLEQVQRSPQPGFQQLLVREPVVPALVTRLGLDEEKEETQAVQEAQQAQEVPSYERCSLYLYDQYGPLGMLHVLRPTHSHSCVEEGATTLFLWSAQLAAGIRCALKAQSLVKEQGRLAAIFQSSTEGILTVDNALRIVDFNPAMERLTGWRESEVLGRFYFEVLRPKDRQGHDLGLDDSPILQAFAGQSVTNREMMLLTRDGQRFTVAVTASCVRSARGEPMNGILNVRDITREREQEEQRSTFISVVSHELQTPIAIIKGYASTLARKDMQLSPKALRTRLLAIEEEADRLNMLVGNLLYASRIQAGGLNMEIAPLDLENLVRRVVRRVQAKSPAIAIATVFPANLPTVMADRDRIEEVLLNLLDNAIKYSPRQREITISCRATGDEVIVSVKDAGMGISLREQEHIFERFHRVGDPMSQATPGTGLGLYICRAIVEAHGGHIWVESTLHQGSTFSFSLPREEKAQLPMVVF
jgi:PAS domain S-box-containing protein